VVEHITVPDPLPGQNGQAGDVNVAAETALVQVNTHAGNELGPNINDGIAGMSTMRGLMLYGAVLAFAALYIDFIVVISTAKPGFKPTIDATLISAAAALSGVLGSAFALKIGITPSAGAVNKELAAHTARARAKKASALAAGIRRALSLEPSDASAKSWPLTFGIWAYAIVASSVVAAYILNQNETPGAVKALAVTFGGYVIALINMAYGMTKP
jgi:hypothetical protein